MNKLSLKDILKINFRGLKLIHNRNKASIPLEIADALLITLSSYWNFWFLARLIDHVSISAPSSVLITDTVLIVGGDFLLRTLKCIIDHLIYYDGSSLWEDTNLYLNRKLVSMDYEYMESEKIQNQKRNIDEMVNTRDGGGMNFLFWRIIGVVSYTLNIVISVVYMIQIISTGRSFFSDNTFKSILLSTLFIAIIIFLVLISMKRVKHLKEMIFHENELLIPYNREMRWYTNNCLEKEAFGKSIRLFHQQPLLENHLKALLTAGSKILICREKLEEKTQRITDLLQAGLVSLVYLYLGIMAIKGLLSPGDVILYAGSITIFASYFSEWIYVLTELMTNTAYVKAYFDFLDIPNKKYEGVLPVEKRDDDQFELEFRNVSFKYPGCKEYVLKDFSIRFRIGERLAVVGKNGSGKTTFIKLLCRLYDPTEGEILLNGINIKKYDYKEYLNLFSVIFQDFKLISLPLGENVSASIEYDKEKAIKSLIKAGMDDTLKEFDKGLNTILFTEFDTQGIDVSGGEAQKIAIARALYHDTPFIILDEPTSALDPLAEYEIYSKFDQLVGTKTAVYISHRLSSCQFCNDIIVIDQGKLIQRGSHEELVKDQNNLYYQLWSAQAQYYQ
ncbi:MAG: ABC transporter ATP-binding protein [Bacillota bacterium]|nr:ABC transporter ATP-binding protein [Bacillota bacterium]